MTYGASIISTLAGNLDVRGRNISVCSFICYDREIPESAQLCGATGAELVLMPTACPLDWDRVDLLAVRAMGNAFGVAMTNYANSTDNPAHYSFNGHSLGIDAEGNYLTVAPGDPANVTSMSGQEGVFMTTFNMTAIRKFRASLRGMALRAAHLPPWLCRMPVSQAYSRPHKRAPAT